MKTLIIAFKFIKKHWFLNLLIILEVLYSIYMFTALYIYITDSYAKKAAIEALGKTDIQYILLHEVRSNNDYKINAQIQEEKHLNFINKLNNDSDVYMHASIVLLDIPDQTIYAYGQSLIEEYSPKIHAGTWLDKAEKTDDVLPAVVSGIGHYKLGNEYTIEEGNNSIKIRIVGIIPNGYPYLTANGNNLSNMLSISPAIIIRQEDIASLKDTKIPKSINTNIVFLKSKLDRETLANRYLNYGISNSFKNSSISENKEYKELIIAQSILSIITTILSTLILFSTEIIYSINSWKKYTVYYLLGMKWKKCAIIECLRHLFIITPIILITLLLDKHNLLSFSVVYDTRAPIFYISILIYVLLLFFLSSFLFIRKLLKQDISKSLRNLNGGE